MDPLNGHGNLFPTIFKSAKYFNPLFQTACYTDNSIIVELLEKRLIDYFAYYENDSGGLVTELGNLVETEKPEVVFLHINNVETAGTTYGFGSSQYLQALEVVDAQIGVVLNHYQNAGILDETLILITSDHGGHSDGSFGYADLQDVEIPWIVVGPSIQKGYTLQSYVRGMDIPSTALYSLGIEQPGIWQGHPIIEAWSGSVESPITPPSTLTNTVVVVDISGLTPNAISGDTSTLQGLMANGASTVSARAVMPSTTLSNVASIIMGAGPEETGVCSGNIGQSCTWDSVSTASLPPITGAGTLFPSVFDVLNNTNTPNSLRTGAFFNYQDIMNLLNPTQITEIYQNSSDASIASQVANFLKSEPNYVFVQFDELRQAGEQHGYNSTQYYSAAITADQNLAIIVDNLQIQIPDHVVSIFILNNIIKFTNLFFLNFKVNCIIRP